MYASAFNVRVYAGFLDTVTVRLQHSESSVWCRKPWARNGSRCWLSVLYGPIAAAWATIAMVNRLLGVQSEHVQREVLQSTA